MTLVRKIIIVLVGVSLAILVTVLFLNPESVTTLAQSLSATSGLIRLPLAILVDVIVLAVLVVLVRGERTPHSDSGLMVKANGVVADVSIESATDRILRAVLAVPDVHSAQAQVKALHGKADVELDVVVSHKSTNLPDKQRELDRALRQVINKQLGLQMAGKPRVHIRMDDEKSLSKAPEVAPALPTSRPTPPVSVSAEPVREEVKQETILPPEINGEEPIKVETVAFPDTMTVRSEEEEKPQVNAAEGESQG